MICRPFGRSYLHSSQNGLCMVPLILVAVHNKAFLFQKDAASCESVKHTASAIRRNRPFGSTRWTSGLRSPSRRWRPQRLLGPFNEGFSSCLYTKLYKCFESPYLSESIHNSLVFEFSDLTIWREASEVCCWKSWKGLNTEAWSFKILKRLFCTWSKSHC